MINNKYQTEWNKPPINFINIEVLREIISKLSQKFKIIYNRPEGWIVNDNSEILEFNDKKVIKSEFPDVIFMEDLRETGVTFNTLQCSIMCAASGFVSVQGGSSILSSLWGKRNVIFSVEGGECDNNTYSWYNKFSSSEILHAKKYDQLISFVDHF